MYPYSAGLVKPRLSFTSRQKSHHFLTNRTTTGNLTNRDNWTVYTYIKEMSVNIITAMKMGESQNKKSLVNLRNEESGNRNMLTQSKALRTMYGSEMRKRLVWLFERRA